MKHSCAGTLQLLVSVVAVVKEIPATSPALQSPIFSSSSITASRSSKFSLSSLRNSLCNNSSIVGLLVGSGCSKSIEQKACCGHLKCNSKRRTHNRYTSEDNHLHHQQPLLDLYTNLFPSEIFVSWETHISVLVRFRVRVLVYKPLGYYESPKQPTDLRCDPIRSQINSPTPEQLPNQQSEQQPNQQPDTPADQQPEKWD